MFDAEAGVKNLASSLSMNIRPLSVMIVYGTP